MTQTPPLPDAPTEITAANGDATTAVPTSLTASTGEQCPSCAARLAPEQRYCVECGERRGQSRLPFATALEQRAQPAPAPPPRRPRLGANGALVAGVGTLVLALGVGVLIGRSGNSSSGSRNAPAAQIIRVPAAAGAASTATASTGSKAKKPKAGAGGGNSKKPPVQPTAQKPGSNVPPPAVKVGSPGHGKGYKNGKFTGDFFGG